MQINLSPEEQIKRNLCRHELKLISPVKFELTFIQYSKAELLQGIINTLRERDKKFYGELSKISELNEVELNFNLFPPAVYNAVKLGFRKQLKERIESAQKKGINIISYEVKEAAYRQYGKDIIEIKIIFKGIYEDRR